MNKRLKILFLSNRIPFPIKDGQSRRTYNILRGLGLKHDVYLLSLYDSSQEIDEKSIQNLKSICENVELHPGPTKKIGVSMVFHLIRSLFSLDPYTVWRHYSKSFKKRIEELLISRKFDLIHCDILPLAYTVVHETRLPRIITDHDVSYLKALRMAQQTNNIIVKGLLFLESFKLKQLESKVFKMVELGVVVSDIDKRILNKLCPEGRFEVIENGVDTDEFKPDSNETDKNMILWVGGFDNFPNREGIYYFFDNIYPLIQKQVPQVKITLVGGGVTERLRKAASADPSISIAGYVDDPVPFIRRSAVFIVPILSGSGTRLKLLEAMAAGKAIVTTSIGCEGIEGENNKHFVTADEPKVFAENVVKVLNDSNLQKCLGENARDLAKQKYDWTRIFKNMDSIYNNLKR